MSTIDDNTTTTTEDTGVSSTEEKAAERKLAKQENGLKQQLKKMKKVLLTIPEDPLNPDDVVPIGWNGVIYAVPRGIEVEVPEVIANIWRESYQKTQEVNKRIRESTKKELKII
ncbi:hypothetical protein BSK49_00985 [Paenibacillus odorifer]|uniref:hypothetical protein n=1 Tax=Paenibacillus odorifer TaxID=189426 RepID=UPI00096CCFAF|nr:hypothetical protein [Paenibacillus odorifer]OMD92990.1 hypothetical protein BSK49_00985 [Paenibacillus odorifer]